MRNLILLAISFSCWTCTQPVEEKIISQYSIDQFYKNTRIGGGAFSDAGTKLLVHSDETGIFNLYEINIADGTKTQRTHSDKESLFSIDFVPGTDLVLYSADKGGNEIDHIYLLEENGNSKDLTPGETEKANFFGWSTDKKAMFYLSNKRDSKYFDLYKMPIDTWQPEMIYQN